MIGERYAAVRAFVDISAFAAAYEFVCAAPVNKQDALLAALKVFSELILEPGADITAVAAAKLAFHIDYADGGKLHLIIPLIELKILVLPCFCGVAALQVGSGRAQQ